MLYAENKRGEMARSILPSTRRRQTAAELNRIRRRDRHSVRRDLRRLTTGPLDWADDGPHRHGADPWGDVALTGYPTAEIRSVVKYERRTADKLNLFERRAVAVTAGLRRQDRLSAMRAMLPGGLIGAHALSHLAWRDEFRLDEHYGHWRRTPVPAPPTAGDLAGSVRRVVEAGGHAELNRRVGERRLLGLHDVDAFVADYLREGGDEARRLQRVCAAVLGVPSPGSAGAAIGR